jgi:hypothetical protein
VVNTAKLEGYLINLSLTFEEVAENTWVINDEEKGLEQVVLLLEEPLVIVRVKVMTIPQSDQKSFFEQLLRLNAQDMVHGAYALDGDDVLLNDTLEYDTMDQGELQASLDAIGLALAQHYPILSKYRKA